MARKDRSISDVARMGGNAIKEKNPQQFSEMGKKSAAKRWKTPEEKSAYFKRLRALQLERAKKVI